MKVYTFCMGALPQHFFMLFSTEKRTHVDSNQSKKGVKNEKKQFSGIWKTENIVDITCLTLLRLSDHNLAIEKRRDDNIHQSHCTCPLCPEEMENGKKKWKTFSQVHNI